MSDHIVLQQIERRVGRPCPHLIEEGRCTELCLTSADARYHGLIRHHAPAEQQAILKLICKLDGLRKLDLRRNVLRRLPTEFTRLCGLEQLNLGSNYLGCVPMALQGFHKLRFLQLGVNDLTELPAFLAEFQGLEHLWIHKNPRLKSIDTIKSLKHLKTLNLYYVNLHKLPGFVFEFKHLQRLTLWNISRFPHSLEAFPDLEFFTDNGTPSLRELPPGFTKLRKLRTVRLYQNNLERLPEELGQLENLEELSFYQNQLAGLPDSMARLKRLTKLNLAWNRFEDLPAWLDELPRLEWLGVFENPLKPDFRLQERPGRRVEREWPFSSVCKNEVWDLRYRQGPAESDVGAMARDRSVASNLAPTH